MKDQLDEITLDMISHDLDAGSASTAPLSVMVADNDDDNALEHDVALMTEQARSRLLGEFIGAYKTSAFIQKTAAAAQIHNLQLIKKSKANRGQEFVTAAGQQFVVDTWADFCDVVLHESHKTIDEQIRNINALGDEVFEAMENARVPRALVRQARKLEPEQLAALKSQVVDAASDTKKVAEIFEEIIISNTETRRELTDNIENLERQLEEQREQFDITKDELKQKLKIEKNRHAHQFSRSWPVDVAEIRAVSALATEAIRIQMNNLYTLMAKYAELDKSTLPSTCHFAAGDALAVTITTLVAEANALLARFQTQNPEVSTANISIAPASTFTEDERVRLLYLRHQLMHDNIAGLDACRREVATLKRGPAPKEPAPLLDAEANQLRVMEDWERNSDNQDEEA